MKTVNYYGIEMTNIQGFKFSFFLQRPENPAMNTLTKEQRSDFAKKWLNDNFST